jgi:hypothetical protein
MLESIFNWHDYLELNIDLKHLQTEEEAFNHWKEVGLEQMRLCNKKQLNVCNEFGNEIICYIPYYYYLIKNNLFFENKITTYQGMKPFYCFLKSEQIIEKNEKRYWLRPEDRPFLVNTCEHNEVFNEKFRENFNYIDFYKNKFFVYEKPLLIIHNKYNNEWSEKPINFLDKNTLQEIFLKLKNKYQIVYIRPKVRNQNKGYSDDHTDFVDDLKDYELIEEKFKEEIITFYDLLDNNKYTYNELILHLFSNCKNYICVQGGNSYLISYFFQNMIVYHKRGDEITQTRNTYNGWIQKMNNIKDKNLIVCNNYEILLDKLQIF